MYFLATLVFILNFIVVDATVAHPSVSRLDLPLAPYNVKIYCRNGLSTSKHQKLVLCPSASTTCGYISIPSSVSSEDNNTVIFECVDSSVFISEQEEENRNVYYSYLCSHQPRCHNILLTRLNQQFIHYLEQTYSLQLDALVESTKQSRFCCSNDNKSLMELVNSNSSLLIANTTSVKCSERQCLQGAVGCMTYRREKVEEPLSIIQPHDYLDVKPVEIVWEYDENLLDDYSTMTSAMDEMASSEMDRAHCVYPHFNDEVYRYCLMIRAQGNGNQCWTETEGHRICCCFVENGEDTCTPPTDLSPTTSTTTQMPSTTPSALVLSRKKSSTRRKMAFPPIRKKKCHPPLMDDSKNELECSELSSAVRIASGNYLFMGLVFLLYY